MLDNDSDIDGDTLVVNTTPVVEPTNGSVVLNADGTFVYTPNANFVGSDLFVYEVSDADGETAQATVNITIDSLNDAPVAADDTFTTNEDVALTDSVLSNDSELDGDTLQVNTTPVVGPVNGTVGLNADGTFTYTPNANFFGSDTFTYEVTDGNGGTAQATVNITVGSVNDAPVAGDDSFNVAEDGVLNDELLSNDSDLDGDTLQVNTTPVVGPANGLSLIHI